MLQGQSLYQTNINFTAYSDGGLYRCWERCNDTDEEPSYCYLKVQVVPDTVKMNFRQAILNESYNGLYSARDYPPPTIHNQFDSNDTMTLADDMDKFTSQTIITIPRVKQCWNITICYSACIEQASIQLNVIKCYSTLAFIKHNNYIYMLSIQATTCYRVIINTLQ